VYDGSTMQCFIQLNSNHVWATSGSIVAVMKVHCLCDIVTLIFGLGKFLVGGHEYINKHLYPTCLLGKGALECYKSLKEGLGKRASSYETVGPLVNSIKNGWEETDDAHCSGVPAAATDEYHMECVEPILEHMHSISCMAVATSWNLFSKCLLSPIA
jgi:hypothetical protein